MQEKKKAALAVVIGRFSFIHNGHVHLLKQAFAAAEKVVVIVGSKNNPLSFKNPLSWLTRKVMVEDTCILIANENGKPSNETHKYFAVESIEDIPYNDPLWATSVVNTVKKHSSDVHDSDIVLVGHTKDESSFYLRLFPQWKSLEISGFAPGLSGVLSATSLRDLFFSEGNIKEGMLKISPYIPARPYLQYIEKNQEGFELIKAEKEYLEAYRRKYGEGPFNTVDAVVTQSSHVLMIRRGGHPGRGLWALPGGFLDPKETTFEGCLRELEEETKIHVPEKVLRGSLKGNRYFDHPSRSQRGRIITFAFYFALDDTLPLPKVKGSDDAAEAKWIPFSEVMGMREEIIEDHLDIIYHFIGVVPAIQ